MITLQDLVIKCDNCNGITEWTECDKHEEADFSCYQITCLNCRWSHIAHKIGRKIVSICNNCWYYETKLERKGI